MSREPEWITVDDVLFIHRELIVSFGGSDGVRDLGLLESALHRARDQYSYGSKDLGDLAAAYAHSLAKNHPFVDGNKRVAFLSIGLFLALQGWRLIATQADATLTMLGVAAGSVDEEALAQWIRDHMAKR